MRILNFFKWGSNERKSDFSNFFRYAKSSEKVKLLKKVAREANEDQEELIKRYKNQRQGIY